MKKYLFLLIIAISTRNSFSQSIIRKIEVRDHTTNSTWQVFKIDKVIPATNDGKYERALQQADIIGNDFKGNEKIGVARNSNADGTLTPTNYVPVNEFKMTFCGRLHHFGFRDPGTFGKDDDLGIYIDVNSSNRHLELYKYLWNSSFESPWNRIEGEIDINDSYKDNFPNPLTVLMSDVCMYGPWVIEDYDPSECCGNHDNNNEIHPMDQYWYKDKPVDKNNISYSLNFFVDNSGRFYDRDAYYRIPSGNTFKPWSKVPSDGSFAIAFEINLIKKERLTYWIESISDLGVTPLKNDGRDHYLIFGNDTLARIHESLKELVNIDFENIGFKPLNSNGSAFDSAILRGFLMIKSRIVGPLTVKNGLPIHTNNGNLRLRVEKAVASLKKQKVMLTIQNIRRLQSNSYRFFSSTTNKLYTDPDPLPLDNSFNEKQVYINLTSKNETKEFLIPILEKLQRPYILNNFSCIWEGFLSDKYIFEFSCNNGYSGGKLGNVKITGDPTVKGTKIVKTVLDFILPDADPTTIIKSGNPTQPPNIKVNLFEITYKIDIMTDRFNQGVPK